MYTVRYRDQDGADICMPVETYRDQDGADFCMPVETYRDQDGADFCMPVETDRDQDGADFCMLKVESSYLLFFLSKCHLQNKQFNNGTTSTAMAPQACEDHASISV